MEKKLSLNAAFRKHFDNLIYNANTKAKLQVADFYQKLTNLDHFEKVILIRDELERVKKIISESEYPFYSRNHSSIDWLFTQFQNRFIILNIDESKEFEEAVCIGEYKHSLRELMSKLEKEIPIYDLKDLISERICKYYAAEIGKSNEGEANKIRAWQAEKLISLVGHESNSMIRKIQQRCLKSKSAIKLIAAEKDRLECILTSANIDAISMRKQLKNLLALEGDNIESLNDNILIATHKHHREESLPWEYLYPKYLNSPLVKLSANCPFLACEITLFESLAKVYEWTSQVIEKGTLAQEEVINVNLEIVFTTALETAKKETKKIAESIHASIYESDFTDNQIKKFLIEKLEGYRKEFNEVEDKYYFSAQREEDVELLKIGFITNAFFSGDVDKETEKLIKATFITQAMWEVAFSYGEYFNTHRVDYPDKTGHYIEVLSLMNKMVLTKDLHEASSDAMDNFFKHFYQYWIPIEVNFQNQRLEFARLFRSALDQLQKYLEDAETSGKILYLQTRLRDLRHQELRLEQIALEDTMSVRELKRNEFRFNTLFKEFLKIEADFVKETITVNFNAFPTDAIKLSLGQNISQKTNTFVDVFKDADWERYVKKLAECTPKLLIKKDSVYYFVGNKKIHRGCVAQYFQHLKHKGIIDPSINRDELAAVLSKEIGDFSINGSSLNNNSSAYEKTFKAQLE